MRLNDPLITSFVFKNEEHAIDLAFDNVLDVFDVLEDKSLREYEKAEICLALLLDKSFKGEEAIDIWNHVFKKFIQIEKKKRIKYDLNGKPMPVKDDDDEESSIDLEQDAEYIYASFLQAYNINLFEQQGKMHWLEFKALLAGLPQDTIMQRIRQIREWEPSKGESNEYKQAMRELQEIYGLSKPEEVE